MGSTTGRTRRDVMRAADRARGVLQAAQADDGSVPGTADVGPMYSAFPIIALHHARVPLPRAELDRLIAYFRAEQREDGSFVPYPFAVCGDLCATAAVWAALRTAGLPAHDVTVARAWAFVSENGGLDAVTRAFFAETNFTAIFLAMSGHIDPTALPLPPPTLLLREPVQRYLTGRYDYLNVVVGLVTCAAIVDGLRRQRTRRPAGGLGARLFGVVTTVGSALVQDDAQVLAFLERFQNPDGSLDDTSLQTSFLIGAYASLGLGPDDPRLERAASWLRGMLVGRPDGAAWFSGFTGDVWGTGFALEALLSIGAGPDAPHVIAAARFLLDAQITDGSRVASPLRSGAPRGGGWAFEGTNVTMPDCDDTAIAMTALGALQRARRPTSSDEGPDELALRIRRALQAGAAWLVGMQTIDGGWSAFEPSERKKPRGPMYTGPVGVPLDDLRGALRGARQAQSQLASPAWEDVTARVLMGLGAAGYGLDSPVVWRAREFLRLHQLDHGGFWGRWMVNYLPTTAFVLLGLAAVGDPLTETWHERAVAFLVDHQNADGGWGESEQTYVSPELAGVGPSVAPLTAIVLSALIAAGRTTSPAVERGIRYLVSQQAEDGSFSNGTYVHAFFPPQSFYALSLTALVHPAAALGAYLRATRDQTSDATVEQAV